MPSRDLPYVLNFLMEEKSTEELFSHRPSEFHVIHRRVKNIVLNAKKARNRICLANLYVANSPKWIDAQHRRLYKLQRLLLMEMSNEQQ
jgi:hypothetical protein